MGALADLILFTLSEEFKSKEETLEARQPGSQESLLQKNPLFMYIAEPYCPQLCNDQASDMTAPLPWNSKTNKIIFDKRFSSSAFGSLPGKSVLLTVFGP